MQEAQIHFLRMIFGILGASSAWLANATVPANLNPLIQTGGTAALIAFLSYAAIQLWKANQQLHNEIRNDWQQQVNRLSDALDRTEARENERDKRERNNHE